MQIHRTQVLHLHYHLRSVLQYDCVTYWQECKLRFQIRVFLLLQVQFDAEFETRARQTPSVLFCTGDGLLCRAQWEDPGGSALAQMQDNGQHRSSSSHVHISTLLSEPSSVNGFDIGGQDGSEIVAVVDQECVCYVKRRLQSLEF